MPGLFKSKKQSKDAKRRFERLMMLAKENPDRLFDLSSCELHDVPSSVFVQCKIFLSETLLLHSNSLKSLKGGGVMADLSNLRVLDIHDNIVAQLPKDIGSLTNLQILNVENNKLSELPSSIGDLKKLQSLLARDNFLSCLPNTVGEMLSLRTLDIGGTNKVYYLPKSICQVRTLEALILSKPHLMEYPSPETATEGLEAIQRYICKDVGIEYVPPSHNVLKVLDQVDGKPSSASAQTADFLLNQSSFNMYEKRKEEKRKQQLELEQQIAESQREQAMLSAKAKETKSKNAFDIKKDCEKIDKAIREQQEKKAEERKKMLESLKQVEEDASTLVRDLLQATERAREQEALLEKLQQEQMAQEEYFKVTQEDLDALKKKDTIAAMESILAENAQYNIFIQKYLAEQDYAQRKTRHSLDHEDEVILAELKKQHSNQGRLIEQIFTEENLQKEAFAALQFQRDAIQTRLIGQISQLEDELIRLSLLESKKKKMKVDIEQESLRLLRTELADLLVQLLKEKDQREEMLRERLNEMEQQKEDDQVDFWLVQYQRLLDSKPEVLVQKEHGLEVEIVNILRRADAGHHIPSFARHKINVDNLLLLDEKQLQSIGVFEVGLRNNILREIENFIALRKKVELPDEEKASTSGQLPAPSPQIIIPTAPPDVGAKELENECCVCLDTESDCVFLPCGHVCACYNCSKVLSKCPMCRADIAQKIKIFRT